MPFNVQTEYGRKALPQPEILSFPLETTAIDNVVLAATNVEADTSGPYNGRRYLVAGTILSKRDDNQYEKFTSAAAVTAVDEVQTVTVTATSGTFTLSFEGEVTAPIAENADGAAVEAALNLLPSISSVSVTGVAGGPHTVTFDGDGLAGKNVELLVADDSGLNGGTVTVVETTAGVEGTGAQTPAGILLRTVEFADQSDKSDEPAPMVYRNVVFDSTKIVDFATHEAELEAALTTCEFR